MLEQHDLPQRPVAARTKRSHLSVRDLAVQSDGVSINMVSLVIVKAAITAARELGLTLDEEALWIARFDGSDPADALSCDDFARFLRVVTAYLQDPCAGVRLACKVDLGHLHFLGPLIVSSVSMKQAVERYQLVRRTVVGGPSWRIEEDVDLLVFGHALTDHEHDACQTSMFTATLAYRLAAELVGPARARNLEVRYAGPAPENASSIRAYLPCSVRWGSSLNGVALSRSEFGQVDDRKDVGFADAFFQFVQARFVLPGRRTTWSNRVRQLLLIAKDPSRIELDQLSADWKISGRTVRRHLEAEGCTYKDLRAAVSMELAMKWLVSDGLSAKKIAVRLGYSETNSFRRVFKHHYGRTPSQVLRGANVGARGAERTPIHGVLVHYDTPRE